MTLSSGVAPAAVRSRGWLWAFLFVTTLLVGVYAQGLVGAKSIDGAGLLPYMDTLYGPLHNCPSRLAFKDPTPAVYNQPWDSVAWRQLRAGHFPLWQPHNGFGVPLLASGQAAPFNPLKLILGFGATGIAEAWFLLLRLELGALGMLLLARRFRWKASTGVLVATGFIFSGNFIYHVQYSDTSTFVALPWLLLAGEALLDTPSARNTVLFGAAIGLAGLLGHPEPAVLAAAGTVLAVLLGVRQAQAPWRTLLACVGACGLGMAFDAFTLLPFFELVRHSDSYLYDVAHRVAVTAQDTFKAKFVLLTVHLFSPDARPEFMNFNDYAGAAPLALAPWGFSDRPARRLAIALGSVAALVLLTCPPGQHLSILPVSPNSNYVSALLVTALVLLAGAGLERLRATPQQAPACVVFGGALTLVAVALQWQAQRMHLGDFRVFLVTAPACAVAIAALRWKPRAATASLLLVSSLGLAWQANAATPALPRFDYANTPILNYLEAHAGDARVTGGLRCLLPDTNLMHGLDSLDSYEVFHPKRYVAYMRKLLGRTPHEMGWLGVDGPFDPTLLDLAGVRYLVLASPDLNLDGAIDRFRAEVRELRGYPLLMRQGRAMLFENPHAMPRAFTVSAADYVSDFNAAVLRLDATPARYRARALIESPGGAPPNWRDDAASPRPVRIRRGDDGSVDAAVTLQCPAWLVLSDLAYPGWRAEVDGVPAAIRPADVAFRAVYLGAGAHRVRFYYRPTSFALGGLISLLACGLAVILLIAKPLLALGRVSEPSL
ncbi:MAG TPA: hypothetical protein V6D47_06100 [Oscillatoriaceae cyanobacterium]